METTSENSPPKPQLDSLFTELRELPPQPPRREMLPGLGWKVFFRSPVLLLLPLLLFFGCFPLLIFFSIKASQTQNQVVTAQVIQVEHFGQDQTFVKYRYAANGRIFTGATVDFQTFGLQNLRIGDGLKVNYEKAKPQNSVLAAQRTAQEDFPWPLFFVFPLMGLFFFAPLFLPQVRSLFVARKLFQHGLLSNGEVRFVKSVPIPTPWKPTGSSEIFYSWADFSGTLRQGSMKCDNLWLVQQFRPDCPVVVAYNPQKPRQSILLEPFVA